MKYKLRMAYLVVILVAWLAVCLLVWHIATHMYLVGWAWHECGGNMLCAMDVALIPPYG